MGSEGVSLSSTRTNDMRTHSGTIGQTQPTNGHSPKRGETGCQSTSLSRKTALSRRRGGSCRSGAGAEKCALSQVEVRTSSYGPRRMLTRHVVAEVD